MKILVLSLVFPPDNVSTAHVVGSLASGFRRAGHEVVVLASTPHYHNDDDGRWERGLERVFGSLVVKSSADGLVSYHVRMPDKANPILVRLLSWIWYHVVSTVIGLGISRGCHVILAVPPPPLTIALTAWVLGAFRRIPFVYNVQEIYPDVAVALGALKRGPTIAVFRAIERFVYRKARAITVISAGMMANLIAKGVPAAKVQQIPNFVDPDELPIRPRENAFAAAHGLAGRFVVSYAGNMGVPQGLGTVLEAARRLKDAPEILFLLVGDGAALPELRALADGDGLTNVRFLPYQPYAVVPDLYAASDVCLVPQAEGTAHHGLPSKIYRIMACGRPILGICDAESEVAALIAGSGCGISVRPGDPDALAGAIAAALADRERWSRRGTQGRQFVTDAYSAERVTGQYLGLLERLAADPPR